MSVAGVRVVEFGPFRVTISTDTHRLALSWAALSFTMRCVAGRYVA